MTTELGRVVEVTAEEFGSVLTADHASPATVLSVKSAVDFDERGGELTYPDPADESLTVTKTYLSCDKDANTVTLATGLATSLDRDTRVNVVSDTDDSDYFAQVMIDDEDEPASVRVPHYLRDKLPEGVREEGKQEAVEIRTDNGGEEYVSQVFGTEPSIGATFVDTAYVRAYLTAPVVMPTGNTPELFPWTVAASNRITAAEVLGIPDVAFEVDDPGVYLVIGTVAFETDGAGNGARNAYIRVRDVIGGTLTTVGEVTHGPGSGGAAQIQVVGTVIITEPTQLWIGLAARQTSGITLDAEAAGAAGTRIEIVRIA